MLKSLLKLGSAFGLAIMMAMPFGGCASESTGGNDDDGIEAACDGARCDEASSGFEIFKGNQVCRLERFKKKSLI